MHETFTTGPGPANYTTLSAWESRRAALLATLQAKVFAAVPRKAEEGMPVRTEIRGQLKPGPLRPAVLYIASDGDDAESIDKLLTRVDAVRMVVYPRGVGEIPWSRSFYRDTMRNAMLVGQTVDAMRLADVLAALETLRREPGVDARRIMTLGRGTSGALGLYAAILDPGVNQVMLMEPPSSHVEGPTFLNILRYTDLPEAAALLAPRRLSFFARVPWAFDYTRRVYSLYGKPENIFRSLDIAGVAQGRNDHRTAPGF